TLCPRLLRELVRQLILALRGDLWWIRAIHVIPAARHDVDAGPLRDLFQVLELAPHIRMPAVDDATDAVLGGCLDLFDHEIDVRARWRPGGCRAATRRRRNGVAAG